MTDLALQDAAKTERHANLGSKLIGAAVGTVGGALFGVCFAAVVLPMLSGAINVFVNGNVNLAHPYLYSALAGVLAIIGAVEGYRKPDRQFRRQVEKQHAADQLGFRYADRADQEVVERLREFFPLSDSLSFRNVIERDAVGGRLLVGTVSTEDPSQTVAYFESDLLALPSFILQPNDLGSKLFSKLVGVESIKFESYRDFSRHYDLSATHPQHTRLLFDDHLLKYFATHPGLRVQLDDHRLIVLRPGNWFEGAELEKFIGQAQEIFALFAEASGEARERIATAAPVDPQASAKQLRGPVGFLVRRHLVTRRDVDRFLEQPTPRKVPANIRRQRLGPWSALAAICGPLFAVGGLTFGGAGSWQAGGWNEDRFVFILLGIVITLVGGLTGFFALRYRLRNKALLRHGFVAPATIESVEPTEEYVGNEQQYRAQFRFEVGRRERKAHCNLGGRAAREAKQLAKNGTPVRVLYDRNEPSRILWAESLITLSAEYEPQRSGAGARLLS